MSSFSPDISNEMFNLAARLVSHSSRNLFLTGKAGTGKTTFLKYLKENCLKEMAVVAPTGVAAINAGGVTIHSFFQLPLAPFVPESRGFSGENQEKVNKHSLISRLRLNSDKKKVLQQLELLVIDEVSMVRCDTMDAIDTVLRHVRRRPMEVFGGVQVLFIGDLLQLPPVVKEEEWSILSDYYNGPYFFDSVAIRDNQPLYIEFEKIYRQSEERFIDLLNQVRNNRLDQDGMEILESRYQPGFRRNPGDEYIILTTHNEKARQINNFELDQLDEKLHSFKAEIKGEFPDRAHPAEEVLELKKGAQVMFIRNDTSERGKRYFNGKIGVVKGFDENKILVTCANEPDEIIVGKEEWENIRYSLNKASHSLEEEVLGSFSQYPLRLAWAITIHKSQGLTFQKAIIDAGAAFAPGQVYVALSRCTNLEGMVLQTRIKTTSLKCDDRIVTFSERSGSVRHLQEEFQIARNQYLQEFLTDLFDCRKLITISSDLQDYLLKNKSSFNDEAVTWIKEVLEDFIRCQDTADKFSLQLFQLFANINENLNNRVGAAANYFVGEFNKITDRLNQSPAVTDSRIHAKEWNEQARELFAQVALKKFLLEKGEDLLDIDKMQQLRKKFVVPKYSINAYAANNDRNDELNHPELYLQLKKLRDDICRPTNLPIYLVAGSRTLREITLYLPQTPEELRQISGFGDARVKKYGQQFLDIVIGYCKGKDLPSRIQEKTPKRERKLKASEKGKLSNTKEVSFGYFVNGLSVEEIAKERKLTTQTVESHLAHYVEIGKLPAERLIAIEKLDRIITELEDYKEGPLNPMKERLGEEISYSDIRIALASLAYQRQKINE